MIDGDEREGAAVAAVAEEGETPAVPVLEADPETVRRASVGAVRIPRRDRVRLRMEGRAPARMLTGIVTGRIPAPPAPVPGNGGGDPTAEGGTRGPLLRGHVHPSAVLTPKGKMVAELRLHRLAEGEEGAFLLDLPTAGAEGLREHFGRYLPPRFARAVDVSGETGHLTLLGPASAERLAAALSRALDARGAGAHGSGARGSGAHGTGGQGSGGPVWPDVGVLRGALQDMAEGEEWVIPDPHADPADPLGGALRVVRSGDVGLPAFDLLGNRTLVDRLGQALEGEDVPEAEAHLWEVLRVERGRPVYGRELDPEVIPTEAGLQHRWVDHQKGCYTGQEVIVRIRDRGRVNRHLRGVLLGEGRGAAPGSPIYAAGRDRPVGELRTVVRSPRFGQVVALAYVRREVEPPAEVAVGSHDGPTAHVRALADHGWELVPGDPGT
jgi:tRNA-modifying protein YgfZ